jgi:hypothetical protein
MSVAYKSVDQLQKVLAAQIFHYAKDSKKAAGRALGTLIEVITFYVLKSWGFEHSIAIERGLAEYGNPEITHNVEYSLHPIMRKSDLMLRPPRRPISSARILYELRARRFPLEGLTISKSNHQLLSQSEVLRNSCVVASGSKSHLLATLDKREVGELQLTILEQYYKPYAMFECKRVGIEEGSKKGPQTIEKAKQGAYVAKTVSSLHKIRTASGELRGLVYKFDQSVYSKPYAELLAEILASDDSELLRDFILTVGVVSNHGNWFTSDNHNKELKVLAQSYDWLIFLTDAGLAEFITDLLLNPAPLLQPAQAAFLASYISSEGKKSKNQFTKVQMNYEADQVLQTYFAQNQSRVEKWFNVIAPNNSSPNDLRTQLTLLRSKDWMVVHAL